ncbi:integral membrane protein [Xylogone sp. PMI_703]|nr:integral membrane protein [Xylogone sp. PMI_703]
MVGPDSGVSGGSSISGSAAAIATVAFLSIALYNFIELNFIIFATFKKHSGLYFWSFVIATWAIAPQSVGILIKNLSLCHIPGVYVSLMVFGWCAMVTGQSLVLYSRLHLVVNNRILLRFTLGMIIFDAVICHTPAIVLAYAIHSSHPDPYLKAYAVHERIQVTIFFVQEFTISALYIWETAKLRKLESSILANGMARRIIIHLLIVNIIVILLDITILVLEYIGFYGMQTTWKALAYSIKLKLEFSILNRLVELAREPTELISMECGPINMDGVALETLNNDRCNQSNKNLARTAGYNSYIRTGGGPGDVPYGESGGVIKTTKVESVNVKSGVTLAAESVLVGQKRRWRESPSSSEVDLLEPCFNASMHGA